MNWSRDQKNRIQLEEKKRKASIEIQISNLEKELETFLEQKTFEEQNIKSLKLDEEKINASFKTDEIESIKKECA